MIPLPNIFLSYSPFIFFMFGWGYGSLWLLLVWAFDGIRGYQALNNEFESPATVTFALAAILILFYSSKGGKVVLNGLNKN